VEVLDVISLILHCFDRNWRERKRRERRRERGERGILRLSCNFIEEHLKTFLVFLDPFVEELTAFLS
jgi:hypothetical protein